MNWVLEYWNQIQAGACVVSKRVRMVYGQLVEDIQHPKGDYIFSEARANRPIDFIERFCKHSKGEWAGKPVTLELFQKAYIAALFGFIHKETKLRKYRESLFMVARKNGKSTMLAGIALYLLLGDGEPGAEIYSTATKKEQANLIFDEVHHMIEQSPYLYKYIRKRKSDLYCASTMGKIQALGKNSNTLDGLNGHGIIMDELHGVKDRGLYEVMKQSQSARRQPLLIMITTAGNYREGIFDDIYQLACDVIAGKKTDPTFLPIIYELDSKEEWTQPEAWQKANPGLGTIKKLDDLQNKVNRAKENPVELSGILTKDFDIRETAHSAWLSFHDIENTETFKLEQFRGAYAIGGADLSLTTDLTCATLLMLDENEKRHVTQMYWIPAATLAKRSEEEQAKYRKWIERGLMRQCEGNTIVFSDVTAWFLEMLNNYEITPVWIYYDPYSAVYWVQEMQGQGFDMVKCYQGVRTLSLPMQQLGADLQAKRINYNNNPILKWCLTNTGIQRDRNGNIVPIKNQSPKMRIDGTASLLDAYVGLYDHYNQFVNAR